jgi:hypothetical protein
LKNGWESVVPREKKDDEFRTLFLLWTVAHVGSRDFENQTNV